MEQAILERLLEVDFPGVDALRVQAAAITGIESACSCGCPTFTPILNREGAPASSCRVVQPVSLLELDGVGGLAREVLCFVRRGYLEGIECVFYDETSSDWPSPERCAVHVGDDGGSSAISPRPGVVVRPPDPTDRWVRTWFDLDGGLEAATRSGRHHRFDPDGTPVR